MRKEKEEIMRTKNTQEKFGWKTTQRKFVCLL